MNLSLIPVLLLVLAFGWGGRARATDESPVPNPPAEPSETPEIRAHSQLEFAVYKGDRLNVEVQTVGAGLEFKWVRQGSVICRKAACELATDDWSLGVHRVAFVVFNPKGSLFLRYQIKVLAAPAGYQPGKVTPELIQAGAGIEAVTAEDLTVRTLTGRGFSYHLRKVQVVGPLPRALDWEEKLRTQPGSTLQVGRDGQEQHVVAGESAVVLAKAPSGRRALVLTKGVLRSRQLGGKDPRWSIVVGNWLQVDTDEKGDVLVAKGDGDTATVTVLRGHARVFRRKDGKEGSVSIAGDALVVPTGGHVELKKGEAEAPRVTTAPGKLTGARFAETTPLYLPGQSVAEKAEGTTLLGEDAPESFAEALKLAAAAVKERDWMTAIEALQPFRADVKKSYGANLALGEAYAGVYAFAAATEHLTAAGEIKAAVARPHELLGMVALGERKWKRAMKHFEDAATRDGADEHALEYYWGVASYQAKEWVAAKSHFTYALWAKGDGPLADSAREYLKKVAEDGWLDLRFGLGVVYDGNVLRISDEAAKSLPEGIAKNKSAGWVGRAGFSLWPWRTADGSGFSLSFDAEKRAWLEPSLAKVERLDQTLALRLVLGSEVFRVAVAAYAAMSFVGPERANDAVGSALTVGSPALAGLALTLASRVNLDPLPGRDDIVDPIRDEVVEASERSSRQMTYGLGLKPLDDEARTLSLGVSQTTTLYRADALQSENYKDQALALGFTYRSTLRQEIGLGAFYRKRAFAQSEGGRKDTTTTPKLHWAYRYTTALSQRLDLAYESQASSRSELTFKRPVLGLGLDLAL